MDSSNFKKQIKYLLKERHMTQKALADKLGCSEQQVSNIVNGRTVSDKTILRLAQALEVAPSELTGDIRGASLPIVIFAYHNGEGKIPKTIQELFTILEEWQPGSFLYGCISYAFKGLREKYSHNPEILSLIDQLSIKTDFPEYIA